LVWWRASGVAIFATTTRRKILLALLERDIASTVACFSKEICEKKKNAKCAIAHSFQRKQREFDFRARILSARRNDLRDEFAQKFGRRARELDTKRGKRSCRARCGDARKVAAIS
jgi:hypothetical protein